MKPHFVEDPASWFSDNKVRASVSTVVRTDEDLEWFSGQAYEIGWKYHRRERIMVADFFISLGARGRCAARV